MKKIIPEELAKYKPSNQTLQVVKTIFFLTSYMQAEVFPNFDERHVYWGC